MNDEDKDQFWRWVMNNFDGAGCVAAVLFGMIVVVASICALIACICYWIKELR